MKTITVALIAASLTTLAATLASAQAPAEPARTDKGEKRAAHMQERLKAADKNGDGKISREEAAASLPKLAKQFDKIDANKDGFITREEIKAWHDQHAARKADPDKKAKQVK